MADLYGWDVFTAGESALDLLGNAIRKSISTNIFTGKARWPARALEDEYTLNALKARGVKNSSTSGGSGESYAFRARIIGENSPHEFIPDPCDPAYAKDVQYVSQLISMHTLVVDSDQTERQSITRGDVVFIELERDMFSYDLQYATFLSLVSVESPPDSLTAECGALKNLHWQGADTVSSKTNEAPSGGSTPPTNRQPLAAYAAGAAPTKPCPGQRFCKNNNCWKKADKGSPPDRFQELAPGNGNYRGATITSKEQMKLLRDTFGIKHVVSLAVDAASGGRCKIKDDSTPVPCNGQAQRFNPKDPTANGGKNTPCEYWWAQELGMEFYQFPMSSGRPPSDSEWNKIVELLGTKGNTYIHCTHGVDRTGAVAARWKWTNSWGPGNDKWPNNDWDKLKSALFKYTKAQGGAWTQTRKWCKDAQKVKTTITVKGQSKVVKRCPNDPEALKRKNTGGVNHKLYDWMWKS